MKSDSSTPAGPALADMPLWALAGTIVLAVVAGMRVVLGSWPSLVSALAALFTDGFMAAMVLVAAGGYGYPAIRRLAPKGTPALLTIATGAALGLWGLSTAVLAVGSFIPGSLNLYVWGPVVAGGVVLALWRGHRVLGRTKFPERVAGRNLVWMLVAAAAGMWLAGGLLPPGWLGNLTMDSYDVLEYHLQLPREYYQAGPVRPLAHNVYSHYPLASEMLFLLGMCLRGGAYAGAYAAKMMSGLFTVVAVAGAFGALRPGGDFRARAAAALLATAPWLIYLSQLAMAEPAQVCYLTLALLWLGRWLRDFDWRDAAVVGAMAGAACAAKYLSVGLVAAPVAAVMLAACLKRPDRLAHAALAGGLTAALFAPWLIRNAAATGNPVFPLATGTFGRGGFADEQLARRWRDGHAPDHRPPVPPPPGYEPTQPPPARLEGLLAFLIDRQLAGYLVGRDRPPSTDPRLAPGLLRLLVPLGLLLAMLIRPSPRDRWCWALTAVVVIQLTVWAAFSRGMPGRFAAVCLAPLSLLAAEGLARLAKVKEVRWLRQSPGAGGRWGLAPAVMLLLGAAIFGLGSAGAYTRAELARGRGPDGEEFIQPAGIPAAQLFARPDYLPEGARLMLVGDATAFRFPAGTVYATVFDAHPLAAILRKDTSPARVAGRLREMGVTHVWVSWSEIARLRSTYGWPDEMAPDRLKEAFAAWPVVKDLRLPPAASAPGRPARPARPILTIYEVPKPTAASRPAE